MKAPSEWGLIDTNILIYAHTSLSPLYQKAKDLRDKASRREILGCIAPQNLWEFYSAVTNPKKLQTPLTPDQALREIEIYSRSKGIRIIDPKSSTLFKTIELLKKFEIRRERIFDIYLLATMLDNNVKVIYTEDTTPFVRYGLVKAINPFTEDPLDLIS